MRRAAGAVVLLASGAVGGVGALWTVAKAAGGEWDICEGPDCTSGYAYAIPLLIAGFIGVAVGLMLIRSRAG